MLETALYYLPIVKDVAINSLQKKCHSYSNYISKLFNIRYVNDHFYISQHIYDSNYLTMSHIFLLKYRVYNYKFEVEMSIIFLEKNHK